MGPTEPSDDHRRLVAQVNVPVQVTLIEGPDPFLRWEYRPEAVAPEDVDVLHRRVEDSLLELIREPRGAS